MFPRCTFINTPGPLLRETHRTRLTTPCASPRTTILRWERKLLAIGSTEDRPRFEGNQHYQNPVLVCMHQLNFRLKILIGNDQLGVPVTILRTHKKKDRVYKHTNLVTELRDADMQRRYEDLWFSNNPRTQESEFLWKARDLQLRKSQKC
jgi:hypothetical protein